MNRTILLTTCLILGVSCLWADVDRIPADKLGLQFLTLQGETIQPLHGDKDCKFAAVIFVTTDCPVANSYAPEIQRLYSYIRESHGILTLVHVDPKLSMEDAQIHAKDYSLESPIVIDRKHELVKATGAEVTPEAALIAPDGKLIYRGRISDLYAGYGTKRREATSDDFKLAIDSFLSGVSIPEPRTRAIGCYIPAL